MGNSDHKSADEQIGDYILGRSGVNNGSFHGQVGFDAYEQEKRWKEQQQSWSVPSSNGSSSTKLICNQMLKSGQIDQSEFITSMRDFRERLTPAHLRGYHLWAIPTVRAMRKSNVVSKFVHRLFKMRMMYVKSLKNPEYRAPLTCILLCKIGEKVSYALGTMTTDDNRWKRVYDEKHQPADVRT